MQRLYVAIVLLPSLILFAAGCSSMSSMLGEAEWSENYALEAECDVPEMNDGSMYTSGQTHPPEYIRGERPDDSRFSDAIITLKEPKEIRKIVVRRRSEDVVPIDVNVFAMVKDEWELISDRARGEIDQDVSIMVRAVTSQIKIRAQRATRTAKGKAAIVQSGQRGPGRRTEMERILREPIKIAEIEVYGLKPTTGTEKS